MKFIKPLAALLFAASLSFTLTYCSTPPANNGGGDAGAADTGDNSCVTDSDCGDPKVFLCDAVSGKCQPACTKKEDCGAHPFANGGALEGCGAGLGCNCDERKCVPQACTDDIECGAQICKSGKCQAADATAASCAIAPTYQVMRVGQTATFTATAYDAAKAPINAGKTAITWSAADGSVTSTGNGVFTGKAAGTAATLGVKATVAGKDCFAKVLVVGDAPTGGARVIAVDELTGRPITGATVVYETSTMTEDASIKGSYTLGTAAAGAATVSVFHPDFQYVTLVGVTKKDLYIPVRRNAGQKAGGYKGKYTNLSASSDAHVGISGTSIPGSLTDLDLNVIVGPSQDTEITFSNSKYTVGLPAGVVLGLGANKFKENFQALGVAGTCDSDADELAGTCGTRSAWSVMGDIPVSKLPISQLAGGGGGLNIGSVLASLLPNFRTFKSGVVRDISFKLKDKTNGDVKPLFTDDSVFVPQNLTPNVALSLKQTVAVPKLPSANGKFLDSAIVLAGSIVKGRGVVLLGLTAGVDTNDQNKTADGLVIGETGTNDGKVTLRMAPNHDGTEGAKYGVVTLGLSISGFTSGGRLATSGLVKTYGSLPYGTTVSYGEEFLGFADKANYNFRTGAMSGVTAVTGATLSRVIFTTTDDKRWVVYFKAGTTSFSIPAPPASFGDRTMSDGLPRAAASSPNSERSTFMIQALKAASGTALDLDTLFEFNGTNADNLVEYTTAFSVYDFGKPAVTFVDPVEGGSIAKTATIKVKVANFNIPADGKVEITAAGKIITMATLSADGEATGAFAAGILPAGATTMTARLVDAAGVPLDPKVSRTINVTIQ